MHPPAAQAHYRDWGQLGGARALLVLHNAAHQGRAGLEALRWLELPLSYHPLFRCGRLAVP